LTKNIFTVFLDKLMGFPLWVKQIIFLHLYQNLAKYLSEDFIKATEEDTFHVYVPILTFAGRNEMIDRKQGCDINIYNFLANAHDGLSMLEISMNNFWTMEEVAKNYMFCLEKEYVKPPTSCFVMAMAGFVAGKYRTGEYFKRIGKINVDQLEHTIVKQKELAQQGQNLKMAEIMISLGYITEKDTSSLLIIKEESQKRFILDIGILPKEAALPPKESDVKAYQDEINTLKEQNRVLKEQLGKILTFVKKNG
jgi:hypothetical protein